MLTSTIALALLPLVGEETFQYEGRYVSGSSSNFSGRVCAVDDGVAVLGDRTDGGAVSFSGSVAVFVESSGSWSQESTLFPAESELSDEFGAAVDLDGARLVVGAPSAFVGGVSTGAAYVFERDASGQWTQLARLVDPSGAAGDAFGTSVAIAGDVAVIGAPGAGPSGRAVAFAANGAGGWAFDGNLVLGVGSAGGNRVAVDGDTAVVAATGGVGRVAAFRRGAGGWTLEQFLSDSNPGSGGGFGTALDLDGERVVAGSIALDGFQGRVDVFERTGSAWTLDQALVAPASASSSGFGFTAAIDGDLIAVAAIDYDSPLAPGENGGAAILFRDGAGGWVEDGLVDPAEDFGGPDDFGRHLDLSAGHLIAFDLQAGTDPSFAMIYAREPVAGLEYRAALGNLDVLTSIPPVVGATWTVDVKLDALLPHTGFFVFSSAPDAQPLPTGSVVLVDLDPAQLLGFVGPLSPNAAGLAIDLPLDSPLIGAGFSVQAILIEPTGAFDLSNAADLCVGF